MVFAKASLDYFAVFDRLERVGSGSDAPDSKAVSIRLVILLVAIHNVFNAPLFPFSGALSLGLRAAGNVKFTMIVSIASTLLVRLLFFWIFGVWLGYGVIGIAAAMAMDWGVRAAVFWSRFRSGKWQQFKVIKISLI